MTYIDDVNSLFYNESGDSFEKIPFEDLLPAILLKHGVGHRVLEIGSASGALASWLLKQGCSVTCIEPASELAIKVREKGMEVHITTIQNFHAEQRYDSIIAISSLIHVPKEDLPLQIQKITSFLKEGGVFFVSFIEGEEEGFEDPTNSGKLRYFAKWNSEELENLFSPYFTLLESHKIYNKKMDRTFFLRAYSVK